ncbi:MAG: glutaredoxin family protein [Cardiobacteriaceae bacterium]|nr:glutaredoxin family protein [Cardiobacteriaceae bacterium]
MLTVYVRLGCHLCYQVREWLLHHQIEHQLVDIDTDDGLKAQYDWLVPVVYRHDIDRELLFPFTESQLLEFVL